MNAVQKLKEYTIEDIYHLPEGQRAELIDGQIYMMTPPKTKHQILVSKLNQKIANYIDDNNGNCIVIPAPFAVFLNKDDKVYLEPDISVICDRNKIDEDGCKGAPDWVIEIVSPSNPSHDYLRKLKLYMNAGVREYWIVDSEKDRILTYNFEYDMMAEYTFADKVKAGIYEDFQIDFSKLNV